MLRVGRWAVWLGALACWGFGCAERTVTQADCTAVGERLEAAWRADANDGVTLAETDEFRRFVVDEGKSIGRRWGAVCQAQVGRPVDEQELRCLLRAKRIDDVLACSKR